LELNIFGEKMNFPIIYSDRFLDHQTGSFHPEKPGRLTAIIEGLKISEFADRLEWKEPNLNRQVLSQISRVHTPAYIAQIQAIAASGGGYSDQDTVLSSESYQVATLAVAAWLDGVDLVLKNQSPAFVAARPPGHHALRDSSMGFCVFSNAAIAAFYALDQTEIKRVAILDWDVHHGNGTQDAVWNNSQIRFISLHQAPFYPGTGQVSETGADRNIRNFPLAAGSTIKEYLPLFENQIIPELKEFKPDLLIVSAGFDANRDDPLASMALLPSDYGTFTNLCLQVTSKILFGLEGGYDFKSLSQSVEAVIKVCL
jgi:acetoin utilization deacetylase AcuC-like enzyme